MVSIGNLINLTNIARYALENYDPKNNENRTSFDCRDFMESITSVVRRTPKRCGDFTWYQGQYVIKNRSGLTGGQPHTDGIFDADTAVNSTLTNWMCSWSGDPVGYPIFHSIQRDEATGTYTPVGFVSVNSYRLLIHSQVIAFGNVRFAHTYRVAVYETNSPRWFGFTDSSNPASGVSLYTAAMICGWVSGMRFVKTKKF